MIPQTISGGDQKDKTFSDVGGTVCSVQLNYHYHHYHLYFISSLLTIMWNNYSTSIHICGSYFTQTVHYSFECMI